ncbi:MAG: hypothetical protein MUC43_12725 [Pirellula sp.]|jgi:hypothetical protein|nr:hypothetical protein [Pirellula sp.]
MNHETSSSDSLENSVDGSLRPNSREELPGPPPKQRNHTTIVFGCTALDTILVLVIVFGCTFLADWRGQNRGPSLWFYSNQTNQIGAEYDTIAQAIREGRGFSDVFREKTGPTAWMPPLLVYFTAGVYWLAGDDRETVVEVIVLCNTLSILLCSLIFVGFARSVGAPRLGIALLVAGLSADFSELFLRTHDTWLILLLLCLIWVGLQRVGHMSLQAKMQPLVWGFFGGFVALASPIAGFAWAASTAVQWFFQKGAESPVRSFQSFVSRLRVISRPLMLAAIGSILVVTPWTIRNRIALGKWIPIKSNAMYEVWQSQVLDDDGVLDKASAYQHPWGSNSPQRQRYVEVGEVMFIQERSEPTWRSIRENPLGFVERVANRFCAAALYYVPLEPENERILWANRITRVYFPLPIIAFALLLWFHKGPLNSAQLATISLYLFYLGPYVMVSYYARYAAPLVIMKMLLVLHAYTAIVGVLKERQAKAVQVKSVTNPLLNSNEV